MTFTINRCAAEGMEETYDRYEKVLEDDPTVYAARMRIKEIFDSLRDTLIKLGVPAEKLRLLDELEDEFVNLESEKLKTLARTGCIDVQVAFELGQAYCKLEMR